MNELEGFNEIANPFEKLNKMSYANLSSLKILRSLLEIMQVI